MRRSLPLLVLLLATAACGQQADRSAQPSSVPSEQMSNAAEASADVAEFAAPASRGGRAVSGPNVGPTAAPGVAFNYRYAFRLAAPRIAEVQEQHAQLCERLTVARCRITGMLYRVVNDRDIEAMLAFKLDPSIARHFGRSGVEAVVRAEGMLTESEITGTDVGSSIQAAGRSLAEMNADLARIEARLSQRISADERARLDYEAQQLRDSIRAVGDRREEDQQSLATTPMVFNYGSGELVPGFDERPSFRRAWERALGNVTEGTLALFIIVVTLLPWALLALLGWLAFRTVRRRWFPKAAEPQATPAP